VSPQTYGWNALGDPELEDVASPLDVAAAVTAEIAAHAQTPHGGAKAWEGVVAAALGDGDPSEMLSLMQTAGVVSPTPTNISITVARCSLFRLATALTVANMRWYGVGATTAVYRMAVYRVSDRVRVTPELNPNTTANAWNAAAVTPPVVLAANTLYAMAVSVDTIGTTPGILACGASTAATAGQIAVLPTSWPGSLDIDAVVPRIGGPAFAQFAVTAGALPATAPAFAAPAAWTGGMPAVFLDSV
jgi:hypothetical protein